MSPAIGSARRKRRGLYSILIRTCRVRILEHRPPRYRKPLVRLARPIREVSWSSLAALLTIYRSLRFAKPFPPCQFRKTQSFDNPWMFLQGRRLALDDVRANLVLLGRQERIP